MSRRPIAIQRAPEHGQGVEDGRAAFRIRARGDLARACCTSARAPVRSGRWRRSCGRRVRPLSPLFTLMPVRATSPLTLTRPSAMRCSSARREPSPACASTLCRRSSSLLDSAGFASRLQRQRAFVAAYSFSSRSTRMRRNPLRPRHRRVGLRRMRRHPRRVRNPDRRRQRRRRRCRRAAIAVPARRSPSVRTTAATGPGAAGRSNRGSRGWCRAVPAGRARRGGRPRGIHSRSSSALMMLLFTATPRDPVRSRRG